MSATVSTPCSADTIVPARGTAPARAGLVVVCDPQPLFRLGLVAVLARAGYDVQEGDDPLGWRSEVRPHAFVVTATPGGPPLARTIGDIRERWPDAVVVAILPRVTAEALASLLAQGASAAAGRDEDPEGILETLRAAARHCVLLPVPVARQLAERAARPSAPVLQSQELAWLRLLAAGRSVTDLARSAGYSRRQMHRELSVLYARLGVAGRAEALIEATRAGLL